MPFPSTAPCPIFATVSSSLRWGCRLGIFTLAILSTPSLAQQKIGSVAMQDATVAGSLEVTNGRALLVGSSSVTARDHAAEVTLERGGTVTVCQTSGLHLAQGAAAQGNAPLMLALDRGAVEVKMNASANDTVLTPDLRFSVLAAGPLDLRLRVTPNGDTCVEHRGPKAPVLSITNSFGDTTYELHPGQHVLFEHGNLREVVDHETSACGCPPRTMSLAEAALLAPANDVAAQHPFPAAQSAGLEPDPAVPQATPGEVHTQLSTTMSYDPGPPAGAPLPPAKPVPAPTPQPHGFAHAVGHFFHRIFGGSKD